MWLLYKSNKRTLFSRYKKSRSSLSDFTYLVLKQAGPKNLPKNMHVFWNGVPEGSHSRPPGRTKPMAFERILPGRKSPLDVWPGPPRCLGAAPCSGPADDDDDDDDDGSRRLFLPPPMDIA